MGTCILVERQQSSVYLSLAGQQRSPYCFSAVPSRPYLALEEVDEKYEEFLPLLSRLPLVDTHLGTVLQNVVQLLLVALQLQ